MKPAFVYVLVTFQTIIVHHERFRAYKLTVRRARLRRLKIAGALLGADLADLARIERVHDTHHRHKGADGDSPANAPFPLDLGARVAVEEIQHNRQQRSGGMQSVHDPSGNAARRQLRHLIELNESEARNTDRDSGDEQGDSQTYRQTIGAPAGGGQVGEAKNQKGYDEENAE